MTPSLIKSMIFSGLRSRFPNYTDLLIYVQTKKAIVRIGENTKETPIGDTDEKYFKMLQDAFKFEKVEQMYFNPEKDAIVIRGIDKENEKKEMTL